MAQTIGTDLTQGNVGKQLLKFSLPFMLANLLQTVYNMVDTIVVGHFVGAQGLSAVSTCGELVMLYTFIAIGFGGAGQTLIGQLIGAGKKEKINRTVGTLFTILFLIAVLCTIFCFLTFRWQLKMVNLPDEAMDDGRNYFLVCAAGFIFIFGYNLVSSILRGMGDSKRPLYFVAIASVVNLILDLLFVPVLGLGTAGAALATVTGQAVSFLCALVYLYRRREAFGFDFKLRSFRPKKDISASIIRLGIPMSAQGGLICISLLYVCSLINAFGVAASAANGITLKLNNITRIVTQAMGTSCGAMIAQCVGAQRYDRAKQVFNWSMLINVSFTALCALALFLFHDQIFAIFNTDADVIAYASVYMIYGMLDYLAAGIRSPFNAIVNGTGAAALGMAASIVDGVVARIGFSVFFGTIMGMGVSGYWMGNMLASFMTLVITLPYYVSGRWMRRKRLV